MQNPFGTGAPLQPLQAAACHATAHAAGSQGRAAEGLGRWVTRTRCATNCKRTCRLRVLPLLALCVYFKWLGEGPHGSVKDQPNSQPRPRSVPGPFQPSSQVLIVVLRIVRFVFERFSARRGASGGPHGGPGGEQRRPAACLQLAHVRARRHCDMHASHTQTATPCSNRL